MMRLVLVAMLVVLGGCKIRIEVPEGGSVATASGRYGCAAGSVCRIDVSDTAFDERFVAVADDSHVFRGWRRGDGYFCGGKAGECALATTGFAGNAGLMKVLESDRVFHLVPVFEPAEFHPVSGTITATAQSRADSDVNDPVAPYTPNDTLFSAQPVSNPATIGGYANLVGEGAPGPSTEFGDPDDYFSVDLLAGQVLTLNVAEPEAGDLDLYLVNDLGEIVDFSLNTSYHEAITVAESGYYVVNVYAYSGASNYTLTIGRTSATAVGGLTAGALFEPDEVVIQYRAAATAASAASAAGGSPTLQRLSTLQPAASASASGGKSGADKAGQFASQALEQRWRTLSAIKRLNQQPGVEFAEPNYRYLPNVTQPDDQYYSLQWHYRQINLPAAWDITRGSRDVVVAVVDTGVLQGHPDLAGKLVAGYDFISDPYVSGDGDGIDPDPEDAGDGGLLGQNSYHGTHVSGTVAAATDNGRGVAGVGWRTRVMPVRVLGEGGGTLYDIVQGIRFAADMVNDSGSSPARRADVINLSLGGYGRSEAMSQAITMARERGIIVVAAAGNDNTSQSSYPAAYPGVVSVGAVGPSGLRAPYSNFGGTLDLVAPGGDSTYDLDGDGNPDGVISLLANGEGTALSYTIGLQDGTSMAAPHVAGVVALMKAVRPGLTPDEFDSWLQQGRLTTELGDSGWDGQFGHGLIDAGAAVRTARNAGDSSAGVAPILRVYPQALALGAAAELVTVSNGGGGSLVVSEVTSSAGWLDVTPASVDGDGLGQYRLRLRSGGLSPGVYEATMRVVSGAGTEVVNISATVSAEQTSPASAGTLWVLLLDETGATAQEQALQPTGGRYSFDFPQVKEGTYELLVGSDMDNDFIICDAGESCGAYGTLLDPATITLDGPRRGLTVNAGFSPVISAQGVAQGTARTEVATPRSRRSVESDAGDGSVPVRRPAFSGGAEGD